MQISFPVEPAGAGGGKQRHPRATTETLFARYPGARRVVLEDTGQLPWLEPSAFRNRASAFFGR